MPRHRHPRPLPPPPHDEFDELDMPPPRRSRNGRRHPLPPHLREEMAADLMSDRQRRLIVEILGRGDEAERVADVLADSPPEFAALSALVLGVYERLSRSPARS